MTNPDKKERPVHPGSKPIGITLPQNYTQADLQRAPIIYKQRLQEWEKAVEEYERFLEEEREIQ